VLKDAQLAPEIIAVLKERKLGQAALVVPQFGNGKAKENARRTPEKSLGWAVDKVKAPELVAPLIAQLLRNVAIFEHLDDALAAKKKDNEIAAATLDGELISIEGIVSGGSREASADSLLERKARMSTLDRECSEIRRQRDVLLKKCNNARGTLERTTSELEKARRDCETVEHKRTDCDNRILLLTRELQEGEQKQTQVRSEQSLLARQIQAADERIAKLEDELAGEQAIFEANRGEQESLRTAQGDFTKRENETVEELNELRLAVATERQRHDHLIAQRQPMSAREVELGEAIAARTAEIANFEKRVLTQAEESQTAESAIDKQTGQRADLEKALAALTEQRRERSATMNEAESNLRTIRNSLNDLRDSHSREQVREAELQLKIDNLTERISRRYQVDLREFRPDQAGYDKTLRAQVKRWTDRSTGDVANGGETAADLPSQSKNAIHPGDADLDKLIGDLRSQLDNMGPVNLDAVQEYDELEERYKFLDAQNNDLTNSRRELLDVIAQINSTTRKLFSETFAQVRINFREMFEELFGGGRADLSLLDESDPLNCGIEISAKPPGKQLQSVSLLSGGERSMVAVALLFSIYMVRPSPFCILDEVDAAMDEGNINRFIRMLDRFVEQSQFIIITHNKRTIAKADVLYGVTMEERGVSKLVGMKLTAPHQVSAEAFTNVAQKPRQQRLALATR
jgi:chromosome segregation protein